MKTAIAARLVRNLLLASAFCLLPGALLAADAATPTVLVTGSSRGIGLELVREYAKRGYRVIATARKPAESKDLNQLAARSKNVPRGTKALASRR